MFIQAKPAMYRPSVSIKLKVVRRIKLSQARPEAELGPVCRKESSVAARDSPGKTKNVSMKVKQMADRRPFEAWNACLQAVMKLDKLRSLWLASDSRSPERMKLLSLSSPT